MRACVRACVSNTHHKHVIVVRMRMTHYNREALRRAYNTLDNMEGIKLEDFLKLMDEYSPQTRK